MTSEFPTTLQIPPSLVEHSRIGGGNLGVLLVWPQVDQSPPWLDVEFVGPKTLP
jgi:hypothetical protein